MLLFQMQLFQLVSVCRNDDADDGEKTKKKHWKIFYLLEMDVLRVHLHRSCSGPVKRHSLSQFSSSEKQPENENEENERIKIDQ